MVSVLERYSVVKDRNVVSFLTVCLTLKKMELTEKPPHQTNLPNSNCRGKQILCSTESWSRVPALSSPNLMLSRQRAALPLKNKRQSIRTPSGTSMHILDDSCPILV